MGPRTLPPGSGRCQAPAVPGTALTRLRDDGGQSAAEYLGVIVVVAVVIGVLAQTGIGEDIARLVKDTVGEIGGGGR